MRHAVSSVPDTMTNVTNLRTRDSLRFAGATNAEDSLMVMRTILQNDLPLFANGYVPEDSLLMAGAATASDSLSLHDRIRSSYLPAFLTERRFRSMVGIENRGLHLFLQVLFYVVLAFILLTAATAGRSGYLAKFGYKLILCIAIAVVFYLFTPVSNRKGEMIFLVSHPMLLNPMVMLKCSFTLIVALLYGKLYELVYQRQHVMLENEVLRNENLENKYNMLVAQMNPHFLFNSLNSLSMLVRKGYDDKALGYIDRLSDTFRYIIQNGQHGLTTLYDELKFLDSFKYLYEVRYAEKLFFDVTVDPEMEQWQLPSLSLQPLIENAVKHNSITRSKPFHITICTRGESLVVSNPVIPKIGEPKGTGIGLKNLSSRYLLLTGRNIGVQHDAETFSVILPLVKG